MFRTDAEPATPDVAAKVPAPIAPSPVTAFTRVVAPFIVLGGLLLMLMWQASRPLVNADTFFHLRFGAEFLSGRWSIRDPGSVTSFGTADWLPTQWLPQVVMAQMEAQGGLAAVAWFAGLQYVVLALAVWIAARRSSDLVVASTVTVVVLIACSPGISMRPQVVSYALAAMTAATWVHTQRSGRTPWALIPLTWFWTTYHGMWPVGIVIGLAAVAGMALDHESDRARLLRHLMVPVLASLAACLTPAGPRLFVSVLEVNSRAGFFSEWAPPDLTAYYGGAALVLVATVVLVELRRKSTQWFTILVVGTAAMWASYSMRTVPIAAATVAPFTAAALQTQINRRRATSTRCERKVVIGLAAGSLTLLALVVPQTAAHPAGTPAWLEAELKALPEKTVIVNDTGFGGYLMWAYPQLDVMISGYGDIYTDAELRRNAGIQSLEPGWDRDLRGANVRVAVVDPDRPLGYALERDGWQVIGSSASVALLVAPPDW